MSDSGSPGDGSVESSRGDLPLLLRADDAASYVGVSRSEFYRLDGTGRVPAPVRFGKLKRWSRAVLRVWVEMGCPPRDERRSCGK